jgi:hypothetical protein
MATRSHARGGSLKAEQCDASSSARLSGGLVATIVAGPFCARSRAVHDQRACRLELLSGRGSPGRRPRLSRGTGTRPVPNHAGNGRTLRRSRSPRGVSQSRIRAGFRPPDPRSSHSSHARDRLASSPRAGGAPASCSRHVPLAPRRSPEGQARAVRGRLDDCFRRRVSSSVPDGRICRGLIRSFRRFARQPM